MVFWVSLTPDIGTLAWAPLNCSGWPPASRTTRAHSPALGRTRDYSGLEICHKSQTWNPRAMWTAGRHGQDSNLVHVKASKKKDAVHFLHFSSTLPASVMVGCEEHRTVVWESVAAYTPLGLKLWIECVQTPKKPQMMGCCVWFMQLWNCSNVSLSLEYMRLIPDTDNNTVVVDLLEYCWCVSPSTGKLVNGIRGCQISLHRFCQCDPYQQAYSRFPALLQRYRYPTGLFLEILLCAGTDV
jgi:hypothetical protein